MVRIPTGRRRTVGYITNMAKDLNSGLPRTNKPAIRVELELRASELQIQHTKFLYQEKVKNNFLNSQNSLSIKLSKGRLI